MMYAPDCPDHRTLVFDFARGRLDDRDAMRADQALEHCASCREWWHEQFSGESFLLVDEACSEALAKIELPPRRRTHRHLWAAAAMIALVFGVASVWQAGRAGSDASLVAGERISSFDFESAGPATAAPPIAQLNFESAVIIADSTVQGDSAVRVVTSLDFESGSLTALTPNT